MIKMVDDSFENNALKAGRMNLDINIILKKNITMKKITYEYLKENDLILFETVVGSQAYGTETPESDVDKKFKV